MSGGGRGAAGCRGGAARPPRPLSATAPGRVSSEAPAEAGESWAVCFPCKHKRLKGSGQSYTE